MISTDTEFFNSPYYFFIKENKNTYDVYFSVAETLTEARKKDKKISIPKNKLKDVTSYIRNIKKKHNPKNNDEVSSEIEELVNLDGALMNSKIPILDPTMHPRKTMDQTIAMARQTNDPIMRRGGYRSYYGEGKVSEVDMSSGENSRQRTSISFPSPFGYEETKYMDGEETYNYFIKELGLEPSEAEHRTREQGKDPSGKMDDRSKYKDSKNFVSRLTLSEIQKQKMIKVLEDTLVNKKNSEDIKSSKEIKSIDDLPVLVKRNLKVLISQADKHGISKNDIIKFLKSE